MRIIQASLRDQVVSKVTCGGKTIASNVKFASVVGYQAIPPGTWTMAAVTSSGNTQTSVHLAAGTIDTLVVLDGAKGLQIDVLQDAAGAGNVPVGAVSTGFGGTAAHGPGSPAPWLAIIAAGVLVTLTGGLGLRRRRLDLHTGV